VLARIIKILSEKGQTNRTALATAAGVSYDRLVQYLDWMTKKDFVILGEDGNVHLTAAGSLAYEQLVQWIIQHVGQLRLPRTSSKGRPDERGETNAEGSRSD
jgi:predicted transcriptional regulator